MPVVLQRNQTNLNRSSTAFFSREAELATLARRSSLAQLTLVTGATGAGKTRLATHFALKLLGSREADEAWLCDLSDLEDIEGLAAQIARTLMIDPRADGLSLDQTLFVALNARGKVLLIIDSCRSDELGDILETLRGWMDACPQLSCVALSCQAHTHASVMLEGLSTPEALELFMSLADQPGLETAAVASALERVGTLPRVVELLAGQRGLPSPAALADLDTSSAKTISRGLVEWSWDNLNAPERAALCAALTFAGSFSTKALSALLPAEFKDGADQLAWDLSDRQLLGIIEHRWSQSESRFEVGADVRAFVHEKVSAEEAERAHRRHADFFLTLAERARLKEGAASEAAARVARLRADLPNIFNAVRWALDHRPTPASRALAALADVPQLMPELDAQKHLYDLTVEALDDHPKVQARALMARARIARRQGLYLSAGRDLDAATRLVPSNERIGVETRLERAMLAHLRGEVAEATLLVDPALELARQLNAKRLVGRGLQIKAAVSILSQDLGAARSSAQEALSLYTRLGDDRRRATSLTLLAALRSMEGRWQLEIEHLKEALEIFEGANDAAGTAQGLLLQGLAQQRRSSSAQVEQILSRAERLHLQLGKESGAATALLYLGRLHLGRGSLDEAQTLLQRALDIHLRCSRRDAAIDLTWLGALYLEGGNLGEAKAHLSLAVDEATAVGDLHTRARAMLFRALTLIAQGHQGNDALRSTHAAFSKCEDLESETILARIESYTGVKTLPQDSPQETTAMVVINRLLRATRRPLKGLVVERAGMWFQIDGGPTVKLDGRKILRSILVALMSLRLEKPGKGITTTGIQAIGWPGDKMLAEAARNRVYVAVLALRDVGLREFILNEDGRYLLDPEREARWD